MSFKGGKATVTDVTLQIAAGCTATTDGTVGSTCAISTTANSIFAGTVQDNKRANVEAQQAQIEDGGSDGMASSTGNTVFERQGIWIP